MGRWRPPPPNSSPYITGEGFKALQTEQEALWARRKHVTKALSEAAAEGDRSENAEYIYRKKELREIDGRIRYLQKRLPILKVVTEKPTSQEQIYFGAWVTLENDQDEEVRYRIVGPDEIGTKDYISMDAPLARALLKKNVDDEVKIKTEFGEYQYLVVDIEY